MQRKVVAVEVQIITADLKLFISCLPSKNISHKLLDAFTFSKSFEIHSSSCLQTGSAPLDEEKKQG